LIISQLETSDVLDITVSYKYCCALLDKGEMRQWGKFLFAKHADVDVLSMEHRENKRKEKEAKLKAIKRGEKIDLKTEFISKVGG
jgi:hypothetical protein